MSIHYKLFAKRILSSILMLPLFSAAAFGDKSTLNYTQYWDGVRVRVEVRNIRSYKEYRDEIPLVYGTIVFEEIRAEAKTNLSCISISLDGVDSEKIYIDSVAHILTKEYKVERGTSKIPVYWKMKSKIDGRLKEKIFKTFIQPSCKLILFIP